MKANIQFTAATEAELNEMLAGRPAGYGTHLIGRPYLRLSNGATGVVWKEGRKATDPIQPIVLVSRQEEHRRLCGRFAQLRSDLSPLTVWCHLVTPERFEVLDELSRDADLQGYEAAWTGLVIAEALLLSERPLSQLRVAACLATQTFAVARALALWGDRIPTSEILNRFDLAQRLFRGGEGSGGRLRKPLQPIWDALTGAGSGEYLPGKLELRPVIEGLRRLHDSRISGDEYAAQWFAQSLAEIAPEASALADLSSAGPEERLQRFDKLVSRLDDPAVANDARRRLVVALLAGFLATVAAGGAPSLPLAEAVSRRWPEITAWAYVAGGIGERIVWTSGFDGLGRLVARELLRPLRLDEPPTCDVALDEAQVLVDPQLKDPLVHLKLKQARVVTLALFPGVNIAVPMGDGGFSGPKAVDARSDDTERRGRARVGPDVFAILADSLWPYLRERLEATEGDQRRLPKAPGLSDQSARRRKNFRERGTSQTGLPLKDPRK